MYPEVHTLVDANLRLERCGGNAPPGHRNLLTPSYNARCRDSTKGPLRAVTEPVQMQPLGAVTEPVHFGNPWGRSPEPVKLLGAISTT